MNKLISHPEFQMDDISEYSITLPKDAERINTIIIKECKKLFLDTRKIIITDATSCVGGNSLAFCKIFKKVNSVEIDKGRCQMLSNNLKLSKLSNYEIHNENYLDILDKLDQHVIFIDPPWGGKDYKLKKNIELDLGGIQLSSLIEILKSFASLIIMKLPLNYNVETIKDKNKKIYNLNKMIILVISVIE
jgi:16S rRNA G966 N2-methylase RsmD